MELPLTGHELYQNRSECTPLRWLGIALLLFLQQSAIHIAVQADFRLCGEDRKLTVHLRRRADDKVPGKLAKGKRLRDRLLVRFHVLQCVRDKPDDSMQGRVLFLFQP